MQPPQTVYATPHLSTSMQPPTTSHFSSSTSVTDRHGKTPPTHSATILCCASPQSPRLLRGLLANLLQSLAANWNAQLVKLTLPHCCKTCFSKATSNQQKTYTAQGHATGGCPPCPSPAVSIGSTAAAAAIAAAAKSSALIGTTAGGSIFTSGPSTIAAPIFF